MMFPFIKEAVCHLFSTPSTEKYPLVKKEAPKGYRGKIAFDASSCIGCGSCIKVCSPSAITKTVVKTEEGDQITFTFDLTSCTFCQMCADFCPKSCIEMTNEYSMIGQTPEDLLVSGSFVKKAPAKKPKPEAKPVEAKPVEAKTEEVKPVETKTEEAKPVETKTEEVKPVETKTEEAKPVEPKTEEAKPVEPKTEEVKPVETKIEEADAEVK